MEKINLLVQSLHNLKLIDIIVYDMRERSPFYDFVVLATATNTRQLQATIKHLKDDLAAAQFDQPMIEGAQSNAWVLADAKDVIVNIFTQEERAYYNIEKMWLDIPRIDVDVK